MFDLGGAVARAVLEGFLCINKHKDITSRGVVNIVQRQVRPKKVGHAGTLDPLATGVLVVAVGRATKLIQYVQQMPKQYVGTFELGKSSDTEDITGEIKEHQVSQAPSTEDLKKAVGQQVGSIMQRPPAFSALNVNGKRAYDLARKGEQVELKPRKIQVHEIEILEYDFPLLKLKIDCGSGTYIRSIGRDIGDVLGCGAVMTDLERTLIGEFTIDHAKKCDELDSAEKIEAALQPLSMACRQLPKVELDESQLKAISFGRKLTRSELNAVRSIDQVDSARPQEFAALDKVSGDLVAILVQSKDSFRPAVNFVARS